MHSSADTLDIINQPKPVKYGGVLSTGVGDGVIVGVGVLVGVGVSLGVGVFDGVNVAVGGLGVNVLVGGRGVHVFVGVDVFVGVGE